MDANHGATNTTNKQTNTMEATQWWSLTVIYHLATSTKIQTTQYSQIFSPNTDNPQKTVYRFKLASRRARLPRPASSQHVRTGHVLLSKWPRLSALSNEATLDRLGSSMSRPRPAMASESPRWKKCVQRRSQLPSIVQVTGASCSQWKSRYKAASLCNNVVLLMNGLNMSTDNSLDKYSRHTLRKPCKILIFAVLSISFHWSRTRDASCCAPAQTLHD